MCHNVKEKRERMVNFGSWLFKVWNWSVIKVTVSPPLNFDALSKLVTSIVTVRSGLVFCVVLVGTSVQRGGLLS